MAQKKVRVTRFVQVGQHHDQRHAGGRVAQWPGKTLEEHLAPVLNRVAMRRILAPEEIAMMAVFLAYEIAAAPRSCRSTAMLNVEQGHLAAALADEGQPCGGALTGRWSVSRKAASAGVLRGDARRRAGRQPKGGVWMTLPQRAQPTNRSAWPSTTGYQRADPGRAWRELDGLHQSVGHGIMEDGAYTTPMFRSLGGSN
jgi:hypothetical protein